MYGHSLTLTHSLARVCDLMLAVSSPIHLLFGLRSFPRPASAGLFVLAGSSVSLDVAWLRERRWWCGPGGRSIHRLHLAALRAHAALRTPPGLTSSLRLRLPPTTQPRFPQPTATGSGINPASTYHSSSSSCCSNDRCGSNCRCFHSVCSNTALSTPTTTSAVRNRVV